jgi:hypothetical protein
MEFFEKIIGDPERRNKFLNRVASLVIVLKAILKIFLKILSLRFPLLFSGKLSFAARLFSALDRALLLR